MAHNEPYLLKVLISLIDDARNDIYVMVDKKTNLSVFSDICTEHSRLVWCKRRTRVYWGHVSQIENELNLFEEARRGGEYAYYHLISGVDLPIKSQNQIHDFFVKHDGNEFIAISDSDNVPAIMEEKLKYYKILSKYFRRNSRIITGVARRIRMCAEHIQKILHYNRKYIYPEMKYGSNWVSVTQPFVDYLLSKREEVLKEFRGTYCPDEVYKQTLAWHSRFREKLYSGGNMRLIDWTRGGPYIWRSHNIKELTDSECLFARKFSSDESLDYVVRLVRDDE